MTVYEAKAAIDAAIQAVRDYKRTRGRSLNELNEEKSLVESTKELIHEAKELGLAGQRCPLCNGTGRL